MKILVDPAHAGRRLDTWLGEIDVVGSRTRAADLIARGLVRRNDTPLKPSVKVVAGWEIDVALPPATPSALLPLDQPLDIVYEDADLVVVDKPSGLVVHPAAGHAQDTLVNVLLHHVGELAMGFGENRPGIVHRLDRETSGVLVVAKNDAAHRHLAAQFRAKTAHRVYECLTHGRPRPPRGTVRTLLGRSPRDRKKFASGAVGKPAVTHYDALAFDQKVARVECRLETGRTHQIRVHLSELGCPILGDPIYGRRGPLDQTIGRLALHARELGFTHPRDGRALMFNRPWPAALADFAAARGIAP